MQGFGQALSPLGLVHFSGTDQQATLLGIPFPKPHREYLPGAAPDGSVQMVLDGKFVDERRAKHRFHICFCEQTAVRVMSPGSVDFHNEAFGFTKATKIPLTRWRRVWFTKYSKSPFHAVYVVAGREGQDKAALAFAVDGSAEQATGHAADKFF